MDNKAQIIQLLQELNVLLDSTPKSADAGDSNKLVRELGNKLSEKLHSKFPHSGSDFQVCSL